MRVIAGTARGMKLKAPRGEAVRPTADRVKEALFSILGAKVSDAWVVDLFAGSGALGIEALSRGASYCTFVEKNKNHLAVIRHNLEHTGLCSRSRLLGLDAASALKLLSREGGQADLFFLDPPYRSLLVPGILRAILELKLLRENGLIVVEYSAQNSAWAANYPQIKQKKYGQTRLALIDGQGLAAVEPKSDADGAEKIKQRRRRN